MAREIILVRHGEAYNTVEPDGQREVRDRSNPPLTLRGERQAVAAAHEVARFAPDVVVTSPFLRAAQTAFAYLEIAGTAGTVDVRMSEHFVFDPLAEFGGLDLDEYRVRFGRRLPVPADLAGLAPFPRFPEAPPSVISRVSDLVDEWLARTDWASGVFYGHGATVSALARLLDPGVVGEPPHASLTHLIEQPSGSWRAVAVGRVDHLRL